MTNETLDTLDTIAALFEWHRFTSLHDRLRQVYPDGCEYYWDEKADLAADLALWWAYLDGGSRTRMLAAARARWEVTS